MKHPLPRIFVQIASYRDPECQHTVKDLFDQAEHPERIFVGICNQFAPEEDAHCFEVPPPYPDQVRTFDCHPSESKGGVWARHTAQTLCEGEEYTLGIDAHMRFVKGWDTQMIAMLAQCDSDKPVLSTMLPEYHPPRELQATEGQLTYLHVSQLGAADEPQPVHLHGGIKPADGVDRPFPSPFWIGNFIFCRSTLFDDVPHDPNIFFQGEEICFAARLFTHGYDIFQPHRVLLYHQWAGRDKMTPRSYRNRADNLRTHTLQRVRHLLRLEPARDKAALRDIDTYGLGTARSLEAYWKFAGIDLQTGEIQDFASRGDWEPYRNDRTMTDTPHDLPRIFVQIASYRDPECQWTLKSMFDQAEHPERIFAGVCWQYDPEEDADCFRISTRPDQVRIAPFHWKESLGVCWARNLTQQLWEGEEYTLVIDSHMRFEEHWDTRMLAELAECDAEKPLLSCHPASYSPPNDLEQNPKPTIQRAHFYDHVGDMRFKGEFLDRNPERPLNGAFIAAGFMFSSADVIREVPYDPHLYFNQEEISFSARLYTHGWNVFSSKQQLLYHYYHQKTSDKKRPLHWEDNQEWLAMQERARVRYDHLIGYQPSTDKEALKELETYGLGSVRTLAQYEAYCGVEFARRHVSDRALRCHFIRDLEKYKNNPVYIPEIDDKKEAPVAVPSPAAGADIPPPPPPAPTGKKPSAGVLTRPLINAFISPSARLASGAPEGIMLMENYLEPELCKVLTDFADASVFTKLQVVDHHKSNKGKVEVMESDGRVTDHVDIDGMSGEILSIFNDVYCNRLANFYDVEFEWYERPQILRYPPGGKYNRHADADHWLPDSDTWVRTQDRDYSVLLYLNQEYEGGSLYFPNQDFRFKPKTGLLAAFPSDHRFLHEAEPTTSGLRYVIVSWSAILGTPRVRDAAPYASVFVRQKRG